MLKSIKKHGGYRPK